FRDNHVHYRTHPRSHRLCGVLVDRFTDGSVETKSRLKRQLFMEHPRILWEKVGLASEWARGFCKTDIRQECPQHPGISPWNDQQTGIIFRLRGGFSTDHWVCCGSD
ncbi:MAG: hypothetical protein M3Y81_06320, partial [Chloroflexota bacterium]|nr:hypothetical protein [Chloroflexota bacterium]